MKIVISCIVVFLLYCNNLISQPINASFSADEATQIYYQQGFDSEADFSSWNLQSQNSFNTWHLVSKPYINGLPSFTTFNAKSIYSLAIRYDDIRNQNESITSPEIYIKPNSSCKLYSCFSGGLLVFARWKILVENTATHEISTLFDAFEWAQEVGFDGPSWVPFTFDLSKYADQTVRFTIVYIGSGGEDVLIDGFQVVQKDTSHESKIEINEGDKVHFQDHSTGNPETWSWEFEGGSPSISNLQHPIVTYNNNGVYAVKLTVSKGNEQVSSIRNEYVNVQCVAPKALIGFPEQGYLSPWVACYVPLNRPLQFRDLSDGRPTSWNWQFPGSDTPTSIEQHPIVSYAKAGINSLSLKVENAAGVSEDIMQYAIQSGGAQYIWNILPEETSNLDAVNLGYYGYYGGTNWLGMSAFAEYYAQPLAPITISSVAIYFASITTVSPDAPITVSINHVVNGLPGEAIVSSSVLAKDLKYSENTFKETLFSFEIPITLDCDYFVVVRGIPADATVDGYDDIAMFAVNRKQSDAKSTVYHCLDEWDNNDQPTGNSQWFKNMDESLSFAITPLVEYNTSTGLNEPISQPTKIEIRVENKILYFPIDISNLLVNIYTIDGKLVFNKIGHFNNIDLQSFESGIYLVEYFIDNNKASAKICLP